MTMARFHQKTKGELENDRVTRVMSRKECKERKECTKQRVDDR